MVTLEWSPRDDQVVGPSPNNISSAEVGRRGSADGLLRPKASGGVV